MIDIIIGMSVLGVALLFAWSIGYKMGYDRGFEDSKKIDDRILDELFNKDEQF